MKAVLIGDIGWRFLYHLGDEAMTEAAIDMLRARGVDDITLVAAQPEVAERFYGLPSVTRVGFRSGWTRDRMDDALAGVTRRLAQGEHEPGTIYAAIRDCDVVIIAGGGNMNSQDYHLLYERLAAKRIAEHCGKPLYVTSQTVGPVLTEQDQQHVAEIVDYAMVFGAREETTAALMRSLAADPARVRDTHDDAIVLTSDEHARTAVDELSGGRPFVVASFTHHGGSIWIDEEPYHEAMARLVRGIAEAHDVDVLLAPHAGSLDPAERTRDQFGNEAIERLADSDRVRATRMITAREDVALIESSRLSLSTRYHPLIFAAATATPAVAIAVSYFSSIRMRGAMGNTGMSAFVLPATSMDLVHAAVAEAISPDAALTSQLAAARERSLREQNAWWDALVTSARSGEPVAFEDVARKEQYVPSGAWSAENEARMPMADEHARAADDRKRLTLELARETTEHEATKAQLARARADVDRYRSRKVIRLLNKLGRSRRSS